MVIIAFTRDSKRLWHQLFFFINSKKKTLQWHDRIQTYKKSFISAYYLYYTYIFTWKCLSFLILCLKLISGTINITLFPNISSTWFIVHLDLFIYPFILQDYLFWTATTLCSYTHTFSYTYMEIKLKDANKFFIKFWFIRVSRLSHFRSYKFKKKNLSVRQTFILSTYQNKKIKVFLVKTKTIHLTLILLPNSIISIFTFFIETKKNNNISKNNQNRNKNIKSIIIYRKRLTQKGM